MTTEQIGKLITEGQVPDKGCKPALEETHISWVLICESEVYKIKKPVQYSFLDFSTLEKRKYYSEREVYLNGRLTDNIYLSVLEVRENAGQISIGSNDGGLIDYAVCMRKMDKGLQMNVLLTQNKVSETDIKKLAEKIASFHKKTEVIRNIDVLDMQAQFNDLEKEKDYLRENLGAGSYNIISNAISASNTFIERTGRLFASRLEEGFYRDCHGDLHSRNIFLLPGNPQPFDCLEFNDSYRQVDVLNEVAFLCMDLDAFGKQGLSHLFITTYNEFFSAMRTLEEQHLFVYYKAYRANIRAKVNSLRARSAGNGAEKKQFLAETEKYLRLMDGYLKSIYSS